MNRRCKSPMWAVTLVLCAAATRATTALGGTSGESSDQSYLESVYCQFQSIIVPREAAEKVYGDFVRIHVEPVQEAYQLLVSATQGEKLDADQARRIMQTVRPVVQVDTLRRMVVYGFTHHGQDANEFYASRRTLLEKLIRYMPSDYTPVLENYESVFDDIYKGYTETPDEAFKLNKAWCAALDDIRAREVRLYGLAPAKYSHRLPNVTILRHQFDQPICGAASLAMGLEVTLQRKFDPYEIANVIGWEGTTGPMMWAYAYQNAGVKRARLQVLSLSELKELVSRNVAVALLQEYSNGNPFGHARLVVGFDDAQGCIEYVECVQGDVQTYKYSECEKLWAPLFFTALILEN